MMEVTQVKIEELIPYARNSRTHSDAQVAQVAASIKEFGFTNPCLIDSESGIIAGHGRVLAARKLKMDEIPCIVLDGMTDAQKRAYIIADNKLAMNAGWEDELLALELEELKELDFDLDLIGFDTDELDALMQTDVEGLTDDDAVPEIQEEAISKRGDVWLIGDHLVMCGDSTNADDIKTMMDGKKANICFTSPPYNASNLNVIGNNDCKPKYLSNSDNMPEDDYFDFLSSNIDCISKFTDEIFYNIGMVESNKRVIYKIINQYIDSYKDNIYWKKSSCAPHIQKGVINNLVENILCFGNGQMKFLNAQFSQGSYWNVIEGNGSSQNQYSDIHKATFPVYLPENIIKNFTSMNGIVMDCFGGTGSTLIACEKTNRNCRMMELDEKYCDVIIRRWQDFTGREATLESTGETFNSLAETKEAA